MRNVAAATTEVLLCHQECWQWRLPHNGPEALWSWRLSAVGANPNCHSSSATCRSQTFSDSCPLNEVLMAKACSIVSLPVNCVQLGFKSSTFNTIQTQSWWGGVAWDDLTVHIVGSQLQHVSAVTVLLQCCYSAVTVLLQPSNASGAPLHHCNRCPFHPPHWTVRQWVVMHWPGAVQSISELPIVDVKWNETYAVSHRDPLQS